MCALRFFLVVRYLGNYILYSYYCNDDSASTMWHQYCGVTLDNIFIYFLYKYYPKICWLWCSKLTQWYNGSASIFTMFTYSAGFTYLIQRQKTFTVEVFIRTRHAAIKRHLTPAFDLVTLIPQGVTFAELTLPRSGRAGKVTRSPDLDPVVTFATFNPRRPALATTGVRTVTRADPESVV